MFFIHCFPFLCWLKFRCDCSRQVFFHLGDKKWLMVTLDRCSSYTVTLVWELAWANSALVILEEWLSYRGGCLRRFDYTYNASRVISQYLKPLHENGYKINDTQTFASMIKNQIPLSPLSKWRIHFISCGLLIYQHTNRRDHRVHHLSNLQWKEGSTNLL